MTDDFARDAERALSRLMARYAHAIDDGAVEGVLAVLAQDCSVEYEAGEITLQGHDEVGGHLKRMLVGASTHLLSNILVEPIAGGATIRAAAIVCVAREEGRLLTRGVQYFAQCQQVDGDWKISRLQHRSTWQISNANEYVNKIAGAWPSK